MTDIAVVGAGVVGLACAVEFQRRGHAVTLMDPAPPGRHCSFGNAGIIAVSEVFPIISPEHMRDLPRMVLSRDGPVSLRPGAIPAMTGWFLRAVGSLGSERQRRITDSLCALNTQALGAWRSLLDHVDSRDLLIERGMLRAIRDEAARPALERHRRALAARSIRSDLLTGAQIHELEPQLNGSVIGGLLHPGDAHVRNPLAISLALLRKFVTAGGTVVEAPATRIEPGEAASRIVTPAGVTTARRVIVAAGLDSTALVESFGVRAPLQAERGYHLMLPTHGTTISRPVTFQAESCVATPMGDQLRLAGTVEFAGRRTPPMWSRADRLAPIAQRYLRQPLTTDGAERWIGSRPSLPDSLPAIGRLERWPAVGYAFGHQHLGLTQAAISAQLLADLMDGRAPAIDLSPFDISRF